MRGINANTSAQTTGFLKPGSKRAVLFAILVASATTTTAQRPLGGMIQPGLQQSRYAPRIVNQAPGASIQTPTKMATANTVRSNPFFNAPQQAEPTTARDLAENRTSANSLPTAAPGSTIRVNPTLGPAGFANTNPGGQNSAVPPQMMGKMRVNQFVQPDRFAGSPERFAGGPESFAGSPESFAGSPVPLPISGSDAAPIRQPRIVQADSSNEPSRVVPVADARNQESLIQETQPIFFSFNDESVEPQPEETATDPVDRDALARSDDRAEEVTEQPDEHPSAETTAQGPRADVEHEETETVPDSTTVAEQTERGGHGLVQVQTPVQLAPVVDFAKNQTVPIVENDVPAPQPIEDTLQQEDLESVPDLVAKPGTGKPVVSRPQTTEGHLPQRRDTSGNSVATEPVATGTMMSLSDRTTENDESDTGQLPPATVQVAPETQTLSGDESGPPAVAVAATPVHITLEVAAKPPQSDVATTKPKTAEAKPDLESLQVAAADPKVVPVVQQPLAPVMPPKLASQSAPTPATTPQTAASERTHVSQPVAEQVTETSNEPVASTHEPPLPPEGDEATLQDIRTKEHRLHAPVTVANGVQTAAIMASAKTAKRAASPIVAPSPVVDPVIALDPETTSNIETASVVQPMPETSSAVEIVNDDEDQVVLNLTLAQVRSMTIGGRLRRVKIDDKDVCQVFAGGANQIKLIGTGLGTTTLTVWADVSADKPTRKQNFVIEVNEAINATGDKISERTELLNESIDKAFPRASVVVSREGGELVVTGRCDDEESAKQIIRMVRKSCLVPVRDQLRVR